MERTLVLLKPDALLRGMTARVLQRFDDAMLSIVALKMVQVDDLRAAEHYNDLAERRGRDVFDRTVRYMKTAPIIALVLEGTDAVRVVRKLVGVTIPSEASPGTIRGDYAHVTEAACQVNGLAVANLVHASGSVEEAAREIPLWFGTDEIFNYRTLAAQQFL